MTAALVVALATMLDSSAERTNIDDFRRLSSGWKWPLSFLGGGAPSNITRMVNHKPLCTNTCPSARNGNCDDGADLRSAPPRPGTPAKKVKVRKLLCDLGTDCADCGPRPWQPSSFASLKDTMLNTRQLSSTTAPPTNESAISRLRAGKVEVNVAWTLTEPPFLFPFTSPERDIDVSRSMMANRIVEPLYNRYWHRLSRQCCAQGGLVLDVGSNFGYYSVRPTATTRTRTP